MKVLLTGGGGFIGSHVAEVLLSIGHEVRIVDRDPAWEIDGAELIRADLAEPGVAEAAAEDVDAVCHQAAKVGLGVSFADAPGYVEDNHLATARLLAALSESGFGGRFVLASSMVVYGEGRYRCAEHGEMSAPARRRADLAASIFDPVCPRCAQPLAWTLVDEDAPLDPRSVYAASKLGQEHLCQIWARETGGSVVALRYHNVYGPRLPVDTPYSGVAAIWRSAAARGEAPRVFEDGKQMRDFVHVRDVAAANLLALEANLPAGSTEPVNVCSGAPVSILEVAGLICDGSDPPAPRPKVTGQYRMGDVRHVVASPAKAVSLLGFQARVPLEEGLREL